MVRRKGVDAIVLRLSKQGGGGRIFLFRAYMERDGGRRSANSEYVAASALVAPVLAGGLDDAVSALRTEAAWLGKALVDGLCRELFHNVCGMNGVPVEPGLASLPGDLKAAILERLNDAEELARVECTSKELRRLVAEHDGELWKDKYLLLSYGAQSYVCLRELQRDGQLERDEREDQGEAKAFAADAAELRMENGDQPYSDTEHRMDTMNAGTIGR